MADVTIVIPYRDRELRRVERCLSSLATQTISSFEVVFVDYGSEPAVASEVRRHVESRGFAHYVRSETRGYAWNRAEALNVGARIARGKFLLTTDVDMVFSSDFLSVVLERMAADKVLHCRTHYLPRGFSQWDALERTAADLPLAGASALGGCQVVPREIFERLHGFDEYYRYWGVEDRDLSQRLRAAGLEEDWIDDATALFHQWHPPADVKTPGFIPAGLWGRMEVHYQESKHQLVRNGENWGRCLTAADRPALAFVDAVTGRLKEDDALTRFALRPYDARSVGHLVRMFWGLQPGQALAIGGADRPCRRPLVDMVLGAANRLLRVTGSGAEVGYRFNALHTFIAELVHHRPSVLADHYLDAEEGDGFTVLVRGEGSQPWN